MLALQGDLITTEKRAAWCFMEKQVNWRALSELGSQRPDGGGGKAIRHGEERRWFVCSRTVMGALFTLPLRPKGRGGVMEARVLSVRLKGEMN